MRDSRHRDTGRVAYKFHNAILAVNKAIHKEAEELMYKRNIFVVLSYRWPSQSLCGAFGGMVWVPIVSMKHTGRMQFHSLRIHHAFGPTYAHKTPIKSCIMLAVDLDAFGCAARAATEGDKGPAVELSFPSGFPTVGLSEVDHSAGKILCDLRTTKYRSMDRILQHSLLAPLASMTCVGQRVVFTGAICNAHEVAHLKQLMSPSLVCNEAIFLSDVQNLMRLKDIANSYVGQDELGFVVIIYEFIAHRYATIMQDETAVAWASKICPKVLDTLDMMCWETSINIACAKLSMRDFESFGFWVKTANDIFGYLRDERLGPQWVPPAGIKNYHHSIGFWWSLYRGSRTLVPGAGEPPARTVAEEVRELERLDDFPHQAHDLEILKSHPDQEAILSAEVLPFDRCSISQLQFPAMSSYKKIESLMGYTTVRHWHDIESFMSLSDNMKVAINSLQRQRGFQVTDFSLLCADFD
jgi:hypothetical protein